jgi:hypothetical protein
MDDPADDVSFALAVRRHVFVFSLAAKELGMSETECRERWARLESRWASESAAAAEVGAEMPVVPSAYNILTNESLKSRIDQIFIGVRASLPTMLLDDEDDEPPVTSPPVTAPAGRGRGRAGGRGGGTPSRSGSRADVQGLGGRGRGAMFSHSADLQGRYRGRGTVFSGGGREEESSDGEGPSRGSGDGMQGRGRGRGAMFSEAGGEEESSSSDDEADEEDWRQSRHAIKGRGGKHVSAVGASPRAVAAKAWVGDDGDADAGLEMEGQSESESDGCEVVTIAEAPLAARALAAGVGPSMPDTSKNTSLDMSMDASMDASMDTCVATSKDASIAKLGASSTAAAPSVVAWLSWAAVAHPCEVEEGDETSRPKHAGWGWDGVAPAQRHGRMVDIPAPATPAQAAERKNRLDFYLRLRVAPPSGEEVNGVSSVGGTNHRPLYDEKICAAAAPSPAVLPPAVSGHAEMVPPAVSDPSAVVPPAVSGHAALLLPASDTASGTQADVHICIESAAPISSAMDIGPTLLSLFSWMRDNNVGPSCLYALQLHAHAPNGPPMLTLTAVFTGFVHTAGAQALVDTGLPGFHLRVCSELPDSICRLNSSPAALEPCVLPLMGVGRNATRIQNGPTLYGDAENSLGVQSSAAENSLGDQIGAPGDDPLPCSVLVLKDAMLERASADGMVAVMRDLQNEVSFSMGGSTNNEGGRRAGGWGRTRCCSERVRMGWWR